MASFQELALEELLPREQTRAHACDLGPVQGLAMRQAFGVFKRRLDDSQNTRLPRYRAAPWNHAEREGSRPFRAIVSRIFLSSGFISSKKEIHLES